MKYRIENINSGLDMGIWEADSPEDAIEAMRLDAGYDSAEEVEEVTGKSAYDAGIRAYPVELVQMVDPVRAAEGYIEYRGDGEDAEEWLDSLADYTPELDSDGITGWGEYTHLVRLIPDNGDPALYYLAPAAVFARLELEA